MLFVEFFVAPDGSSPVEEYLDGLDAKQAAKVIWTLSAIKLTHPSPSVYLKKMVTDGRPMGSARDFRRKHLPPVGVDGWR